jgi:osomolarity two-component system response regulator SSK1
MMAAGVGSGSGSANNIPLLPAVRLPAGLIPGHPNAGDGAEAENVADGAGCSGSNMRVDLSSSKFGFEVPADARLPVSQNVHDHALELGSSESDSEVQSEDPDGDPRLIDSGEHGEGSQFSTPTNRLNLDTDPLDVSATFPIQPRLSRAFSMPVSSQLGHLKNPRRIASSSSSLPEDPEPDPATVALSSEVSHLHEISLELADSLQMVIQTLLQLSPPQVLDPAKEQFSACSVSIPTPSISSIFTSVKNLNYMAANMSAFGSQGLLVPNGTVGSAVASVLNISETDFDIGELLQSVGDALCGGAAEVGVDIVLYHADVGMKHIAVKGDECGVSYALTHVSGIDNGRSYVRCAYHSCRSCGKSFPSPREETASRLGCS